MAATTKTHTRQHHDVTCLGCGCLCDDLTIRVEGGRIAQVDHACDLGRRWLAKVEATGEIGGFAAIEGRPVEWETAMGRAVELLCSARAPVLVGLESATIESQREAVGLADSLGGLIDASSNSSRALRLAVTRVGRCTATLGEVRARADLVVFWGCDPLLTHPRHLERYSADPIGRFVPSGRAGRFLVVVDEATNTTREVSDDWLPVPRANRLAGLQLLLAILQGTGRDVERIEASTGASREEWERLATRMQDSRYGAVFTGSDMTDPAELELLLLLTRDLNQRQGGRFVHLTLGSSQNEAGAESVLGWQTGYGSSVTFAGGSPAELVSRVRADLRVQIGDRTWDADRPRPPTILLGPRALTDKTAAVAMTTAHLGTQVRGSVMRCDGITLPLRPILATARPDLSYVLHELRLRVTRVSGAMVTS